MGIKESSFNRTLRAALSSSYKIDRIESHATAPGIPDNAFVRRESGVSGWMEVKEEESIPTKIKYRVNQPAWHENHYWSGGISMTILHVKSRSEIIIIAGKHTIAAARDLRQLLSDPAAKEGVFRIPDKHHWDEVARAINALCARRLGEL